MSGFNIFQQNPTVEEDVFKIAILYLEGEASDWWFHGLRNFGHDHTYLMKVSPMH